MRLVVPKRLAKKTDPSPITPNLEEGRIINQNSGVALDDLWKSAMTIQAECTDVLVHSITEDVRFNLSLFPSDTEDNMVIRPNLLFNADAVFNYGSIVLENYLEDTHQAFLTDYSYGQLCNRIGVPVRYMQRLQKLGLPHLVQDNINDVIKAQDLRGAKIRLYRNEVRGFMSDRYTILDAPDILQAVHHSPLDRFEIKGSMIDPTRLHLRMVDSTPLNVQNEDLFMGVTVDSSDVGKSSVFVRLFVWKQVCTNGLMLPTASSLIFKQKHLGITSHELEDGLKNSISICSERAEDITTVLNKLAGEKSLKTAEQEKLLKTCVDGTLFTDDTVKEILDIREDRYPDNRWGVVNAITEYAQRFALERRLLFEEAAGRIAFSDKAA